MESDPSGGDAAPDGDFALWVRISHEVNLELLQRGVEVWADNIVNRLNMFEQFERQRFVANRSRFQFAEVNGFWIGFVHASIVASTCDDKVAFRLICVSNNLRANTAPPNDRNKAISMNHRRFSAALLFPLLMMLGGVVQAQEVSEQFRRLDRNKDGKLTKDEFSGALFDRIDTNNDGIITAEEDRAFVRNRPGQGQNPRVAESVEALLDLPYAGTDNPRQKLDLYLPKARKDDKPLPVVVFIHGGAWQAGDKRGGFGTLAPLVVSGEYAGVSVGYRLTGEAIWPAQIHDCKAAIRWLRANAEKYNLDPTKIGVTGTSAGGHLVAMLGTTGDAPELEGTLGEHVKESSRVQCVVDQFGPTDLLAMGGSHNNPNSPESKLVGGAVQETQKVAREASATTHVSKDDPSFLLIHGTNDRVVPFSQSELLHEALKKVGVESTLVPVEGGGHGGFPPKELADRLRQFFDKHLRGKDVVISSEPIKQGER